MAGWIILRTGAQRTLQLEQSLREAGFFAWTPKGFRSYRASKSRDRRVKQVPIAPSFVFVVADRLGDLMHDRALPVSPHPPFSIFKHGGRIPLIGDLSMQPLREAEYEAGLAEDRAQRKDLRSRVRPGLKPGLRVTVPDHSFKGLSGVIQRTDGKSVIVAFGGALTLEVDAWHVVLDDIQDRAA